ncbi:MAG: hypothetical protein ABSC23_20170 [Bryobacteraceae bacterium]|jgi:tetratricopeptide (TPR) repeat protein
MKRIIHMAALALVAGVFCLAAQQAPANQGGKAGKGAPAQASPEIKAVQAIIVAAQKGNDPDGVIKASDALLADFPDSRYKEMALTSESTAYRQKGDLVKAQAVLESVIALNPKSLPANMGLGEIITQQTGDKDFDKAQKLDKAEAYLKTSLDILNGPKPNPQMSDADWDNDKKMYTAEVHSDLGLVSRVRKDYATAVTEFQNAVNIVPEPAYSTRLADALQLAGKNAESIAVCDKLLADPQLNPVIKGVVDSVRANAVAASKAPAK